MLDRPTQQLEVARHDRAVGVHRHFVRLERESCDDGCDEPCDQQREEDCRRDGEAELDEILTRDSGHETDRQEHRDDRCGGGDNRQSDLIRGIQRRLVTALTHAHVTHYVLDLNDRVIDEHARHQRQREQADRVERESQQLHERKSRNRGQRNRQRGNRRRPKIAQEEPDDDHRENRALDQGAHRRVVRLLRVVHRSEHLRHAYL